MAIIVIMKVSVADAKNNLPELIKAAEKGERQALTGAKPASERKPGSGHQGQRTPWLLADVIHQ